MKQLARRWWAASEILLADAFWGFGFVAVLLVLPSMGPHTLSWLRFLIAGLLGVGIALLEPRLRLTLSREQFQLAFWPGVWLSATITIQTYALKYTTATKGGFITTLYVLIVPFFERVVLKRQLTVLHFVYVAVALLGTALICNFHAEALGFGDIMMLFAALAAGVQIFWFALIQNKIQSPLIFNSLQCLWAVPLPLVFALATESFSLPPMDDIKGWAGVLSLILGSTFFAFALQVKAQKSLSPSVASLLFLLESPFSAIFAAWILDERFSSLQWLGGVLILAAAAASVVKPASARRA